MFTPLILLGIILFALLTIFYFVPLGLWIQAIVSVGLGTVSYTHLTLPTNREV